MPAYLASATEVSTQLGTAGFAKLGHMGAVEFEEAKTWIMHELGQRREEEEARYTRRRDADTSDDEDTEGSSSPESEEEEEEPIAPTPPARRVIVREHIPMGRETQWGLTRAHSSSLPHAHAHPTPVSGKRTSPLGQSLATRLLARRARRLPQLVTQARAPPFPPPPSPMVTSASTPPGLPTRCQTPPPYQLQPYERRVAHQQRSLLVLAALSNGLIAAATMQVKCDLIAFDAGKLATSTGQLVALINLGNLLLGPVIGGLSDRFGRLPFMWLPVVGRLWWGFKMFSVSSIERYQEIGALAFGVCGAGAFSVQQSALDDVFGSRPTLRARIQTSDAVWTSAVGLIAPIVGAEIARRDTQLAMILSTAVWALQIPVLLFSTETLPRQQQKPFSLCKADPLRNISVLFRNGPGLRRLTIANTLLASCSVRDVDYGPFWQRQ